MDYYYYMEKALEQAENAKNANEVPIGAVVVYENKIIGAGFNRRNVAKNALYHGEIIAINQACETLGDFRLEGTTIFVTVEPCPMCAGAIVQARISEVVFGTRNKKAGGAGSVLNILSCDALNHQTKVVEGVMEEACRKLLKDYFIGFRKA